MKVIGCGVVLGMTTLPATHPGGPVCHLGKLVGGTRKIREMQSKLAEEEALEGVLEDLASSVLVVDHPPDD
jgi:hypothetical protein